MDTLTKILDLLALIIQLFGAALMYFNSPINRMPWGPTFYDAPKLEKKIEQNNKNLKNGFAMLAIGIFIAIVSALLKFASL